MSCKEGPEACPAHRPRKNQADQRNGVSFALDTNSFLPHEENSSTSFHYLRFRQQPHQSVSGGIVVIEICFIMCLMVTRLIIPFSSLSATLAEDGNDSVK